jgi:cobalamin synthase
MSEQGAIMSDSQKERPLRGAAYRGFLFGARIGVIIWCLLAIVAGILYAVISIVAWYRWQKSPEFPDGWGAWLRDVGSCLASLVLTAAYGAITGAAIMLAAAILRRRHSSEIAPKQ